MSDRNSGGAPTQKQTAQAEQSTQTPASDGSNGTGQWGPDRWRLGIWAVFAGLAGLLIAFALVALKWRSDQGVAALGAIASPIVAIVSAYFGISATQNASTQAAKAHEQAGEAKAEATRATQESEQSKQRADEAVNAGMRLATQVRHEATGGAAADGGAADQGLRAEPPRESPAEQPPSDRAVDLARALFPEAFKDDG